jgi:hypothetical protein
LDGSLSSDPDGDPLTYKWTAPAGITLSSATAQKPVFTAPQVSTNTNYTFTLVVNDGTVDSPTDHVVVTVKDVSQPVTPGPTSITLPVNNAVNVNRPVSMSWSQSANATKYELVITKDGVVVKDTTQTSTSATIPGLAAYTDYVAKVRGQNTIDGTWSSNSSFKTIDDVPGVTSILTPVNNATNVNRPVSMSWSPSSKAKKYELVITKEGVVVKDTTLTSTSASIPGLAPNTTYIAKVRGQTSIDGTWSNNSTFTTAQVVPIPGSTNIISPTNNSYDLPSPVSFIWSPSTNATKYNLEIALDKNFNNIIKDIQVHNTDTTLTLNGNRQYFNRVRGENTTNGTWSPTTIFTTKNTPPTEFIYITPKMDEEVKFVNGKLAIETTTPTDIDNDVLTKKFRITGANLDTLIRVDANVRTIYLDSARLQSKTTYQVYGEVTDGRAVVTAQELQFKTPVYTGINDILDKETLKVYPNPTRGYVTIEKTDNSKLWNLTITTITGDRINKYKLNSAKTKIDISKFTYGVYLFQFENNEGKVIRKILKN